MKVIKKTYKFELKPTKQQEILLNKHFGCNRFIFNYFLNQRKDEYLKGNKTLNYYKQAEYLTELKKKEEYIWLKEVNSQSLQHSLRHLDTAYINFFKKLAQFPRFKSRKDKNSFHIPQHIELIDKKVFLPKFKEGIKVNQKNVEITNIRNCTISKTPVGKYYISFLCEVEYQPKEKTGKSVGIDLGLKDFVITSDDNKFENHKYTIKYQKKLKREQQHLSRKKKGSNNKNKERIKVARIHEKIVNSRNDMLHKVSTRLISHYDIICCEDLNIKGMLKNDKLSKSISDVSWGAFLTYLKYKSDWNDKQLVKISRWFPSSKTCHKCKHILQDLPLNIRQWECPICGQKHNRDLNAAKNIETEGLNLLSSGTGEYTYGDGGYEVCEVGNR
jgi:putative transposase